ncbi:hypothetical protein, unknown function [Leishmania tarentolae]|uniref:Uncharacterized protein n=1 Tax=Leishmania tarentolae TaxID=5689 RepID=A0A640KQU9_LEITA|nr:hypothetical protein, unknown function [Leishmania tarentolae]
MCGGGSATAMLVPRVFLALRSAQSMRHHGSKPAVYGTGFRRPSFGLCATPAGAVETKPCLACPCVSAHRRMHTSCGNLDGAPIKGRSTAVTDALLSQWSRRSGTSPMWPSHVLSHRVDEQASSCTAEAGVSVSSAADASRSASDGATDRGITLRQPVFHASASPPSIEELFAETDEDDPDTSTTAADIVAENESEELSVRRQHGEALLPRTGSSTSVPFASPDVTRLNDTGKASRPPRTSASSTVEAGLVEALLQERFAQDLYLGVDDMTEEEVDGLDDAAPRAVDTHAILNSSGALPHGQYGSGDLQRPPDMEAACGDGDSDGDADVKVNSIEDAVDDEESIESVLEEEAERIYYAALANMAKDHNAAAQGDAMHGIFSDYTFFSKEAVASAIGTLSASENVDTADDASTSALEFDDDAVRKAEMESVGDEMAISGSAAAAALRKRRG